MNRTKKTEVRNLRPETLPQDERLCYSKFTLRLFPYSRGAKDSLTQAQWKNDLSCMLLAQLRK